VTLAAASRLSWRGGFPVQWELRREGNVMSAFGSKQASILTLNMSAFGSNADIPDPLSNVR
jgi:hypothetical protein